MTFASLVGGVTAAIQLWRWRYDLLSHLSKEKKPHYARKNRSEFKNNNEIFDPPTEQKIRKALIDLKGTTDLWPSLLESKNGSFLVNISQETYHRIKKSLNLLSSKGLLEHTNPVPFTSKGGIEVFQIKISIKKPYLRKLLLELNEI